MILDEPTAGQDYKHYTEFMDFIVSLADRGMSFLFITHDMHLALEYTDRSLVLHDGACIAQGDTSQVLTNLEAIRIANLKETSLGVLAREAGIAAPEAFVRRFIQHERKGRHS